MMYSRINYIKSAFLLTLFLSINSYALQYVPIVNMYLEDPNYEDVENATWVAYDEKNVLLGRSKGDQTGLLQLALNYAVKNGLPLYVTGRTYVEVPRKKLVSFLCTYRTIRVPPVTTGTIIFQNVTMLSRPKDGGPALTFDSAEGLFFEQRGGQILYRGKSAAVLFSPENPTINADDAVQINTSKIHFSAITVQEQGPMGGIPVRFDISKGSIWGNYFEFGETDGFNKGDYVIHVTSPTENSVDQHYRETRFESNMIRASMLVRSNVAGIFIGRNHVSSARIRHNRWDIGSIQPGNSNAIGLVSYGEYDVFNVGLIGSANMKAGLKKGYQFGSSSAKNKINIGQIVLH